MAANMVSRVRMLLTSSQNRSARIKLNIVWTFLLRAPTILIDFLIIRLTLDYLEPVKYGIWVTLTAIIGWLSLTEFGLASGLRNRVAEALAHNDHRLAQSYVSTTYALLLAISVVVVVVFSIINPFIRWDLILNTPREMEAELGRLAFALVMLAALYCVTSCVNSVMKARQMPALATATDLMSKLLFLSVLLALLGTSSNSLFLLGVSHSATIMVAPLIAGYFFFTFLSPSISPTLASIKLDAVPAIVGIGKKFFLIQLCSAIIFSTDALLITQILGPAEVAGYMIVFKYFGVLTVAFAMVSMPFWSAFTDAYAKGEYEWIRRAMRKKILLLLPLCATILLMACLAPFVIEEIWLGRSMNIDSILIALMGLYVLLQAWNRIFNWFLSGIGELNVTMVTMFVGAALNVPLSVFFSSYVGMGTSGIILGTIVSLSFFALAGPIKTIQMLRQ